MHAVNDSFAADVGSLEWRERLLRQFLDIRNIRRGKKQNGAVYGQISQHAEKAGPQLRVRAAPPQL